MERIQQILLDAGYDIGRSGPNKDGVDGIPGRKTYTAATKWVKAMYKEKGWKWHKKDLVWIRMSDDFNDKFSDFCFTVCWDKVVRISNATTLPGNYWVGNPVTAGGITGTGIQAEGQELGTHQWVSKGKKKWGGILAGFAKQIKSIGIYRDGNKDKKLNKEVTQVAPYWFGFFMHAMGRGFKIWNWSAGCMGTPLHQWLNNICPYFNNGDIINKNIIEL